MTFGEVIAFVVDRFEGGAKYTDHPSDNGSATKFGVTRGFRALAVGHPVSKADIKALTREQAVDTYRIVLLERAKIGLITDPRVLFAVFDFAVNSGTGRAIPAMQRAVGVPADGKIGPQTLAALNDGDGLAVAVRIVAERQAFLIRLSYAPQQNIWLRGWLNRCTVNLQQVTAAPVRRAMARASMRMRGGFASHADQIRAARKAA